MIERTQRRLRQTQFFYEHLFKARHQTEGDPEAFRFYFSAFIQAARSVTCCFFRLNEHGGQRDETGRRMRRDPIADMGLVTVDGLTPSVTAISRISVEEVHFGHFFHGRLEIAKMRQEHFPLKRRVRFRCHVVALIDTLD
jgi:hypothetical protein